MYVTAAEEPVAMDTDNVHTSVTEESDLSPQPLKSLTSTVANACTMPDTSVCLLASESGMPKVTLDDVGLDLAEPFSLGNVYYFCDKYVST